MRPCAWLSARERKGAVASAKSIPTSALRYAAFRYITRARGIPSLFQSLTLGGLMSKIRATAHVPPSASITLVADMFIGQMLDQANNKRKPKLTNKKLG